MGASSWSAFKSDSDAFAWRKWVSVCGVSWNATPYWRAKIPTRVAFPAPVADLARDVERGLVVLDGLARIAQVRVRVPQAAKGRPLSLLVIRRSRGCQDLLAQFEPHTHF